MMQTRRQSRGYLLVEAMVAGACLAVILSTTLAFLGDARAKGIYAGRRSSAVSLARQKMDALTGIPLLLESMDAAPSAVDEIRYPGIKWGWTVTEKTTDFDALSPVDMAAVKLFEIQVDVIYPTAQGSKTYTLRQLRAR
jgi:hypothetical protein